MSERIDEIDALYDRLRKRALDLNTFDFLVEYITARVVGWIMRDQNLGLEEALVLFHNSETCEKLCEKHTGLYIESPGYVYEVLNEEFRRGTIRGLTD